MKRRSWQIGGEHGIAPKVAEDLHARISTGSELGLECKDRGFILRSLKGFGALLLAAKLILYCSVEALGLYSDKELDTSHPLFGLFTVAAGYVSKN